MKAAGIELPKRRGVALVPDVKQRSRRATWSDALYGYVMIAPLMLGLLIFYIWPVFQTFYFSFTSWGAFGKYHWTGLANYQQMLSDPEVGQALLNTLIFTVISVPGSMVLSLFVALLLNQKIRGVGIYRTLYFLPAVTMPAAIGVVWRWLYNGDYGLINYILSLFSLHGLHWISDSHTVLYAIIVVAIWSSVGTNMVLFLAGLQSIPGTYYEAASIDGAGPLARLGRITLPLLSPTIFFTTVIALISAFQVFDIIYLMVDATSPALTNAQTVVYIFYRNAFMLDNKGYAAAIAMVLFAVILIVTLVQFRLQRRWVNYD